METPRSPFSELTFIVTRHPGDLLFSPGHVCVLCSLQLVLRGPALSAWEADGPQVSAPIV